MTPLRIPWTGVVVLAVLALVLTASALLGLVLFGGLPVPGL